MFESSVVFEANYNSTSDIVVNQGGTSSGKTFSILQVLFVKSIQESNSVTTVAGQDIPNLKAGAIRDALNIVSSSKELESLLIGGSIKSGYNITDRIFTFTNGSKIEFKSYADAQDAKSGKRKYLFVNEANGIKEDVYEQLQLRTFGQTFIDYNPDAEFWVHDNVIPLDNCQLVISDHRHNPFIPDKLHEKIEALKHKDDDLFKVYARGLTGRIEGLVFRNYEVIDKVPDDAKLLAVGLDFGFTNDPTACLRVFQQGDDLIVDELIYSTGLTNPMICDELRRNGVGRTDYIVADSAEPKSISEIYSEGFNIHGAEKGADSIKNSIDILKRYNIKITRSSTNTRKEIKSYKWDTDRLGKPVNKPVDFNNHAMDSFRYIALNKIKANNHGHYSVR